MATGTKKEQGAKNREWGYEAEGLAAEYFLTAGYVIRERNWRCGRIEIDLILETGRTIIFVEVKARQGDSGTPHEAIDIRKVRKMVKGADIYMSHLAHRYEYRFDTICFTGTPDSHIMEHVADAFVAPVNGGSAIRYT